jgi:hypothetical protein
METQTVAQGYEQKLIGIVRRLPPERVSEVIDFAQFLESQIAEACTEDDDWLNDSEEQMQTEDALWDAARSHHRDRVAALVETARAEIAAGTTEPMFDERGDLAI